MIEALNIFSIATTTTTTTTTTANDGRISANQAKYFYDSQAMKLCCWYIS